MLGDVSTKAAHMLGLPEVIYNSSKDAGVLFSLFDKYFMIFIITSYSLNDLLYVFQVSDFFAKLIQRVSPKSYQQAHGEVFVTQKFLENFCGDQVDYSFYNYYLICYVIQGLIKKKNCFKSRRNNSVG